MSPKQKRILLNVLVSILLLALVYEIIRDSTKDKDFQGYVSAGNLVLSGGNIYSDYLNTWPPFFSVFSVLLAWGDSLSRIGIRFLWLAGSLFSMWIVIRSSVQFFFKKEILLPFISPKKESQILFTHPLVFIPILILFRYVLDNLANIQINMYLLLLCLFVLIYFTRNKMSIAGALLAFGISLKVYPIFIFFYFIFKREWKVVTWTLGFLCLFNVILF